MILSKSGLSTVGLLWPKAVALHRPPCATVKNYSRMLAEAVGIARSAGSARLVAAAGRSGGVVAHSSETRKEVDLRKDSGSAHSRFARTRASEGGPRDSLRSHLPTAGRRC